MSNDERFFVPQSEIFASDFSSFQPPGRMPDSDPLLIAQLIRDTLPPPSGAPAADSEPPPSQPPCPWPSHFPAAQALPGDAERRNLEAARAKRAARNRVALLLLSLFVTVCTGAFAAVAALDGV